MRNGEEHIGAVTLMRFDRPIDRDHSAAIEDWADDCLESGQRSLVLHCGKVPYFDSIGLESLLGITRRAASQGARFALVHLNSDCATTLRVTRLEQAIEHFLTTEGAVRVMRGASA